MSGASPVDREVSRHLARAAAARDSGILTCLHGKLKRIFCLEGGRLVHAASNVIEEQLAEILVRRGMLEVGVLAAVSIECKRQKAKLSRLLAAHGVIAPDVLDRALTDRARHLLYSTLDWSHGRCSFTRGKPDLDGEVTVELDCAAVLVQYARHHPATVDEIRVRIRSPRARPVLCVEGEGLIDHVELDEAGRYLLEHCDGSRPVTELVERSPAKAEPTWRALYGFLLAGILELETERTPRAAADGAVTRSEVVARLGRAEGADHYTVIELNPTCSRDEIREAYYFLARRYHPDRFRSGELVDLQGSIETYFAKVTEAYNTLYDEERRAEYDALRASTAPTDAEGDTKHLARQNFLRARALIEKGRYTDAATSLENAIQLDDSKAEYHLELGQLLARNPRRRKEAEGLLSRVNEIDPALTDGYLALGQLYVKTGREEDAARLFREVLRWEPGHLEAAEQLKALGATDDGGRLRGLFGG